MKINTNPKKIQEALTRGVENVYPSREALEKVLQSGKQLTIYNGIDPTGPTLHIGHGVVLEKLRQLQELGHKIILLIGDFTGMIGDPTDKTATRKKLTRAEVLANCKNYVKQAGKILDMKKVELRYNSEWLGRLKLGEVLELASEFTVQQMMARDMFRGKMFPSCKNCGKLLDKIMPDGSPHVRYKCPHCHQITDIFRDEFRPVYLHEFLYPLMQGYDSVAMEVDMEVGGNDQTFNMLVGRDMMANRGKEKFVLTTKLLVDPTGKKMGKTEGNMVTMEDSASEMYGKVMSWPDTLMPLAFEICTRAATEEIKKILAGDPMQAKKRLAREIATIYHSSKAAQEAEENFVKTFSKKERPDKMPEIKPSVYNVVTALVEAKICSSKGEARRVIQQGGVKINDKKISAFEEKLKKGDVVQKGSRWFVKIG